jgi:hypothetical protein
LDEGAPGNFLLNLFSTRPDGHLRVAHVLIIVDQADLTIARLAKLLIND